MSFLFNMFTRNHKQQMGKYDRISFKINLSEHIPQYYECSVNRAHVETEVNQDHPMFSQIFPSASTSSEEQSYLTYTAKENDTMEGIAIRLDISEHYLRSLNGISGSLYPGMMIKLPKTVDISKLDEEQQTHNTERLRISQLLNSDKLENNVNYKYTVYYYAGPSGDIKGLLTVNSNYIIFNPLLEDPENLGKFPVEKLLKFNVLVQMADIQKAQTLRLPEINEFSSEEQPKFNNIVQFMLYKVGNVRIEKRYKQKLKQLKIDNKAIASISFSFRNEDDAQAQKQCQQMCNIVNQMISHCRVEDGSEEEKKRLTNIPFFDIINEKIANSHKCEENKENGKVLTKTAIYGGLSQESSILTPQHFSNLVDQFPLLYKLYNWQKVYSVRRDGSAFSTFLNKTRDVEPAILLIKEYKGNTMGAFLVESIEAGKTGRGEMFIFTFKGDCKVPEVYFWTTKNDFFVYLEKDQGIGIGMGIRYGLFMNRNLEKGSSAPTNTFGNKQPLSIKEDFQIDDIEVWGVDNTF